MNLEFTSEPWGVATSEPKATDFLEVISFLWIGGRVVKGGRL